MSGDYEALQWAGSVARHTAQPQYVYASSYGRGLWQYTWNPVPECSAVVCSPRNWVAHDTAQDDLSAPANHAMYFGPVSVTGIRWKVFAIRPAGLDYDLFLRDANCTTTLASSAWGTGQPDLVAVDGNVVSSTVNARAAYHSGTANVLDAELYTGQADLPHGTPTVSNLPSGHVAHTFDVNMSAGTTYSVTVSPTSGNGDLGLLVFSSIAGSSATYYRGRSDAIASADANGPGGSETAVVTPPSGGNLWKAVVVYNKTRANSTTFTVTVTP
jgi:hypothetical protein